MRLRKHHDPAARRVRRRERVLKTIGVLPSLATLGNLSCGLGAIYLCLLHSQAVAMKIVDPPIGGAKLAAISPSFVAAAGFLLILAMCFDGIDGRLARLARKTTEFGAQLDSLADVVSFGVAPALMVLSISQPATFVDMNDLSFIDRVYWRLEWVMAAVYVCCAALRLARFNVENEEDESAHMEFRGLPTPGAAGAVIGLVICHQGLLPDLKLPEFAHVLGRAMPAYALLLGLLMVSPFRYPHLVNAVLRSRRPFWQVVALSMSVLIGFVVQFHITLWIVTSAYALSGPFNMAMLRLRGRSETVQRSDEVALPPILVGPLETFEDDEDEHHADAPSDDPEDRGGGDSTRYTA
ncbi:MAG: phosphatidylcholine/phosphatidylserine synthase [Phycisphaerae bacterium]|nr:phosphatidylcholine/phosphatidylserine synthase [Phycisphaerae bacterium]